MVSDWCACLVGGLDIKWVADLVKFVVQFVGTNINMYRWMVKVEKGVYRYSSITGRRQGYKEKIQMIYLLWK